ncbi:MAG: tetratricopeptide repeat protein [Chitinophaga sp.]|uniref:tetratricopeptide repeat protein n=1 Tax=Chitinophaga sp. TaxID=1869181 RepID=UPI0025C24D90|nr:tetratricopeptide repeat protein [Chitinophaga sp.]MBV8251885.1 tetratricopeptide repeat protein [Chitinophaga sp.]
MSKQVQFPIISNETVFEEFVCDLFNAEYPEKKFQRFGKKGNKQYGIDIISISDGIAIQCKKKEVDRKNILNELKKDFESSVNAIASSGIEINKLIIASTYDNNTELSIFLIELKKKYAIKYDLIYLGWSSLSSMAVNHLALLNKYFPIYPNSNIRKKTLIPFYEPQSLVGREESYAEMQKYADKYAVFVVSGIAGIGKSSTTSCFLRNRKKDYDNIIWVDAQLNNLRSDLLNTLSSTFDSENVGNTKQLSWNEIVENLASEQGNNIIVIDGVEQIHDDSLDILDTLCSTGWKVIITSRVKIGDYPHVLLSGLNYSSAAALFRRFYTKDTPDGILEKVFKKIDYHPLLIELIAKSSNIVPNLDLKKLDQLLDLRNIKADPLQTDIHIGKHASKYSTDRNDKIYNYILRCFTLWELSENEKKQLLFFSVLPQSEDIDITLFLTYTAQSNKSLSEIWNTLMSLEKKGWISKRGDSFAIHPMIQSVVQKKLKISTKKIESLIFSNTKSLGAINEVNAWRLADHITIAKNILYSTKLSYRTVMLSQVFGTAMLKLGDYTLALKHYEECLNFLIKNFIFDFDSLGTFLNNLGIAYSHLGRYDDAIDSFNRVLLISHQYSKESKISLGKSLDNFATVLEKVGYHEEAFNLTKKAIQIFKKYGAKKELGIACINIVSSYLHKNLIDKAKYFWRIGYALQMQYLPDSPYLSDAYNHRGLIYLKDNMPRHAIWFYKKSLSIYKEERNPDIIGLGYSNLALAYLQANDLPSAKYSLDKALAQYQSMSIINWHNNAQIEELYGHYYTKTGQVEAAIKCFSTSLALFRQFLNPGHFKLKELASLLNRLKSRKGLKLIDRINFSENLTALTENIDIVTKIIQSIIDEYGAVKGLGNGNPGLESFLHDYIFFCFSKSCKSFLAVANLIKSNIPEDAMVILYNVYRNYLNILVTRESAESVVFFIETPIKVAKGLYKAKMNEMGIPEVGIFIDSKKNKEFELYPSLSKMVSYSRYVEDKYIHNYLNSHLSDHAHSNFMTSGNFRDEQKMHYDYGLCDMLGQPIYQCAYLQILILNEVVLFLDNKELSKSMKTVFEKSVALLISTINMLEEEDFQLKANMVSRLQQVLVEVNSSL